MQNKLFIIFGFLGLTGCMNMPTPPEQITGSYVSNFKYDTLDCKKLRTIISELHTREQILVSAQERRIKTGNIQAFLLGFGNGDGIEAFELSSIRGEKEIARKTLLQNSCPKSTQELFGVY